MGEHECPLCKAVIATIKKHECPVCGEKTAGTIFEGGVTWGTCDQCYKKFVVDADVDATIQVLEKDDLTPEEWRHYNLLQEVDRIVEKRIRTVADHIANNIYGVIMQEFGKDISMQEFKKAIHNQGD